MWNVWVKSFKHKGLEKFYKTGNKAGIQPHHEKRLKAQLSKLDTASGPDDMGFCTLCTTIWKGITQYGQMATGG